MRDISFKVDGQHLALVSDISDLIVGSRSYLRVKFEFDDSWNEYTKAVVFYAGGKEEAFFINDDPVPIPDEFTARRTFKMRVIGKNGYTSIPTNKITIVQGV